MPRSPVISTLGVKICTPYEHGANRMKQLCSVFRSSFLAVLVAVISIVGCSSTGAPYRETREIVPDEMQIVVFRPDSFFQGGIPYQVNINGKEAVVLRNGGFSVLSAKPGPVEIEIRASNWLQALFKNPTLSVNGAAKERVFVRAAPQRGNTVSLEAVSEAVAMPELANLKESR